MTDIDGLIDEVLPSIEKDEKTRAASQESATAAFNSNVKKAVEELKESGTASSQGAAVNKDLMEEMVKSFSDKGFRDFMAKIMDGNAAAEAVVAASAAPAAPASPEAPADRQEGAAAPPPKLGAKDKAEGDHVASDAAFVQNLDAAVKNLKEEAPEDLPEADFFSAFMKNFESAFENDEGFAKSMEFLMSGMLSKDVLCDSLAQVVDVMEPVLQNPNLSPDDRVRYEKQLATYKEILAIYHSNKGEPNTEQLHVINDKLQQLQQYGPPPLEVMEKMKGEGGEPVADDDTFEDFVKNMGLGQGLGPSEQEMIRQLSNNPEDMQKIISDMAKEIDDRKEPPCKQQ